MADQHFIPMSPGPVPVVSGAEMVSSNEEEDVKPKRRGVSWTDEETLALLNIWQDHNAEVQSGDAKMNSNMYKHITAEMEMIGYSKTAEQCKTKIHTLKRSYRLYKISQATGGDWKTNLEDESGGRGHFLCRYYQLLDGMFSSQIVIDPETGVESSPSKKRKLSDDNEEVGTIKQLAAMAGLASLDWEVVTPDTLTNSDTNDAYTPQGNGMASTSNATTSKNTKETAAASPANHPTPTTDQTVKKKRTEYALTSMMEKFADSSEKIQEKYIELEKRKLDVDLKRMELEKSKMEYEERQRREERQHQYNMLQMILDATGHPATAAMRHLQNSLP